MINHIEYAAANYGDKFYRKSGPSDGTEKLRQYLIFRQTLLNLRREHGNGGVVYLNDLNEGDLEYMRAQIQGYYPGLCSGIEFRLLPGSLYEIEHPKTETAHLKFLPSITASDKFPKNIRRIVKASKTGLEFTAELWLVQRIEGIFDPRSSFECKDLQVNVRGYNLYSYQAEWRELIDPSKTIIIESPRS